MSTLSKRDAMQLVNAIRGAKVSGYAIAARVGGSDGSAMAGFVGGLEAVLSHFLYQHGCSEAAVALVEAMNAPPSDAQLAARDAQIANLGTGARSAITLGAAK